MTRHLKAEERQKRARARRETALSRAEFRFPSSPRQAPTGATSFPVKAVDPATADAIAAFLAKKGGDK